MTYLASSIKKGHNLSHNLSKYMRNLQLSHSGESALNTKSRPHSNEHFALANLSRSTQLGRHYWRQSNEQIMALHLFSERLCHMLSDAELSLRMKEISCTRHSFWEFLSLSSINILMSGLYIPSCTVIQSCSNVKSIIKSTIENCRRPLNRVHNMKTRSHVNPNIAYIEVNGR